MMLAAKADKELSEGGRVGSRVLPVASKLLPAVSVLGIVKDPLVPLKMCGCTASSPAERGLCFKESMDEFCDI
jgi:hypothetical protein